MEENDFCRCCKYPHWGDTNVALILKNGDQIEVKCPDRIGMESGSKTSLRPFRQWNTSAIEAIDQISRGLYNKDTKFIIGPWGTGYKDPNYKKSVLISEVINVKDIGDHISIEQAVLRKFES